MGARSVVIAHFIPDIGNLQFSKPGLRLKQFWKIAHSGKLFGSFLKKTKLPSDPAIALLDIYPREMMKTHVLTKTCTGAVLLPW